MADFKPTSYSDGFGIFNKVNETTFGKTSDNKLRLFMLNTENKLFNYDELYEYLLPNIAHYVFSRNTIHTAQQDPKKQMTILVDALSHLREISSKKDKGAGGELGEILLYLFLEQDFHSWKPRWMASHISILTMVCLLTIFPIVCSWLALIN